MRIPTLTRRRLLEGSVAVGLGAALPRGALAAKDDGDATGLAAVDPFIGTGGDGHCFPGPSMPFGMVQLSPDTDTARWATCSGYHFGDPSLLGFSHTHLSGTGIGDMLDVMVLPCTGPIQLDPGPLDHPDQGYRLRYSGEVAEPGYYRVQLENGVTSELTVTARTGIQRHVFPAGPGHLLIDLAHLVEDAPGRAPLIDEALIAIEPDGTLTGTRRTFRWAKGRRIYFAMQFSRPPSRIRLYGDGNIPSPDNATNVNGKRLKAVVEFDDASAGPIVIRTGISAVDAAGARANLEAEAHHFDFDRYRRKAAGTWQRELGAIQAEGGTADERRILATALYHASLGPTLFSDVNGRTIGLDRQPHKLPQGRHAYSTYSLWDTYRAVHPLQTLLRPDQAASFVADLIRQTTQSPFGPPVWPLQGVETGCMIAWHSVAVLAEAVTKGIRADYAAAWPGIRRRLFDWSTPNLDNSLGLQAYDEMGYVPADRIFESVSRTLEYAYDDHAAAIVAEAAGAHEDAIRLRRRAGNWRNVIDTRVGFARGRLADGGWAEPYDPAALGHSSAWHDFTECNGWQATFLNQHDVPGLVAALGGEATFEAKLDALFSAPSHLPDGAPPDISGLLGQYAHGNEPSHHVAYLYAWCGAHWKTQAMVRRLCTEMYKAAPDGIIGNDDCGQMSAWFVFSALGFYPVDPTSGVYVLGSPLFDRVAVQLGNGRQLVIEALGNAPDRPYIGRAEWQGRPLTRCWLSHDEIMRGGTLRFTMQAEPNREFAKAASDRPPAPLRA